MLSGSFVGTHILPYVTTSSSIQMTKANQWKLDNFMGQFIKTKLFSIKFNFNL